MTSLIAKDAASPLVSAALTFSERVILRQIAFWYPRAKTERGGHIWLIKSASEFISHGVDLKEDTIWRAVRALHNREVLVRERHFHPYRPIHGPVFWIRPLLPLKAED